MQCQVHRLARRWCQMQWETKKQKQRKTDWSRERKKKKEENGSLYCIDFIRETCFQLCIHVCWRLVGGSQLFTNCWLLKADNVTTCLLLNEWLSLEVLNQAGRKSVGNISRSFFAAVNRKEDVRLIPLEYKRHSCKLL